jgi:uncharacterized protein YecE (DUF72 family)
LASRKNILNRYFGGLSGLELPVPKYLFPEEHRNSSRLTYYATFFNTIEINSSFYRLPLPRTVSRWVSEVPEEFRFTFKLWQEITHTKSLEFKEEDVRKFFLAIDPALAKKGCILIQFPPSLGRANHRQLEVLLQVIAEENKKRNWDLAVEFRHHSWYEETVYALLEEYNVALVVHDIPKSRTPFISHPGNLVYLRFHGPTGNYRDSYQESFLAEYATFVKEWLSEGKTVYAYFNNTMGGAFTDLQTMNQNVFT